MSHRKFLDVVDLEDLKTKGRLEELRDLLKVELEEAQGLNRELSDSIDAIREKLDQIDRKLREDDGG
jgi:hypothetical protein